MKRINNDVILDTLYDLADSKGMRIDEFLELVEYEFGEPRIDTSNLPEEVINELNAARDSKREQKRLAREAKSNEEMSNDIRLFKSRFPEISADDIPETVWEDVQNGASLSHAYALYEAMQRRIDERASHVNERNGNISAAASSSGSTEPSFTKETVEKMSGKDVKNNYRNILKAMKNWHF